MCVVTLVIPFLRSTRLSVRLSVCPRAQLSLEPLDRSSRYVKLCRSPVAVARSFSGGVALRYVLPVLEMASRLAIMEGEGCTVQRQLMSMNVCFLLDKKLI